MKLDQLVVAVAVVVDAVVGVAAGRDASAYPAVAFVAVDTDSVVDGAVAGVVASAADLPFPAYYLYVSSSSSVETKLEDVVVSEGIDHIPKQLH